MEYKCYYIVCINININTYTMVAIVGNSTIVADALDRF